MGLRERRYAYRDFITPKQTRKKVTFNYHLIFSVILLSYLLYEAHLSIGMCGKPTYGSDSVFINRIVQNFKIKSNQI